MFSHAFRFDSTRLHAAFAPRKPRNPLMRALFGLLGVALLAVLLVLGVFVGAAMLVGGLVYRLWRSRGKPVADTSNVVDGEFRVVDDASDKSRAIEGQLLAR